MSFKDNDIVLSDTLLKEKNDVKTCLKTLYTGKPATYRIFFNMKNHKTVESVFDQIISEVGLRPVFFEYAPSHSACARKKSAV